MGCKLIVKKGPSTGTSYELEQVEIFVGRDLGNDIVVNDPEISRRHARIYKHGDQYLVEDLGSTNGTVVNGQKIRGPKQLTNHDYIAMGQNIGYEFISDKPLGYEAATVAVSDLPLDEDATFVADSGGSDLPHQMDFPEIPVEQPEIPVEFAQVPDYEPQNNIPAGEDFQTPLPPESGNHSHKTAKPKRKIPVWLIIVVILLGIACVCVAGIWIIDSQNLWCTLMPFLPGCPVTF